MKIGRIGHDGRVLYGEIDGPTVHILAGDVFSEPARTGERVPLRDVSLLSPTDPRTLLIMLGGFLKPGATLPPDARPNLSVKVAGPLTGDQGIISVPRFITTPVWIEVELAIVIGRRVRHADIDEARGAIWGYTCFNDVTAPEFIVDVDTGELLPEPQLFAAKSIETFGGMGPWVRTDLDEAEIEGGLRLTARVNGRVAVEGNTRLQKFAGSAVVSYASRHVQLEPGDVIALGAPQVCEAGPGDSVELEIEGIGSFRAVVRDGG